MKVAFYCPPEGNDQFGKYRKQICEIIKKEGFTLVGEHYAGQDRDTWLKTHKDDDSVGKYFRQVRDELLAADICIFELSVPTLALGFLAEEILGHNKTLITFEHEKSPTYMLKTITSDKLLVKTYSSKTIAKTVRQALDEAREQRDKRFNFFINPRLLDYIETVSSEQGVTCSHFLRSLILDHMKEFKTTSV